MHSYKTINMKLEKNREGYLVSDTHRQCTNCLCIFEKTSKTVTLCPKCNSDRVKSQSIESKILRRAKSRAKAKGIPFNLELSDIEVPRECPILGITLVAHSGKSGTYKDSPSLDRIIPELGYIKGNVRVISQLANQMKTNATRTELVKFAEWILFSSFV